jgi:glutathione S-transferase
MIVLYQFPPAFGLPNASPFCMKVENYLRMTGLPYRSAYGLELSKSPKGKLPFIEDEGRLVGDSGLILDDLKAKHGDPLDAGLSPRERAASLGLIRLMEEHLYWCMVHARWIEPAGLEITRQAFFAQMPGPARWIVPLLVRRGIAKQLHGQGMGRHSRDEIYAMAAADIGALADFLGDRPYFLGERPTTLDAAAYAFIANIVQVPLELPPKQHALGFPNLLAYCQRMQAAYYPELGP